MVRRATGPAPESGPAVGQDDLDLDGNWASGGAAEADDDDSPADIPVLRPKKRKKSKAVAAEADESEPPKKKKKQKLQADDDVPPKKKKKQKKESNAAGLIGDSLGGFVAEDGERKKKKKKKPKKSTHDRGMVAAAAAAAGGLDSRGQASARVASAWAAEAKMTKMSALEMKDISPKASWFHDCPAAVSLARLPREDTLPSAFFAALRSGAAAEPARKPGKIAVAVLCLSTERVFEALGELTEAWKVGKAWAAKPLALAAHGGGRRKEQVARQAKAIASGVSVAVGTPGRVLRLLEEKHLKADGLELIVVDLARDRKDRDVLALAETRKDLFALCRHHLLAGLRKEGGCRIAMCGAVQK